MTSRDALIATTVAATFLSAVALGQANFKPKLVPGERWRQVNSMEMEGFKMPAQTTEVCMPKGAKEEQLVKPEKDCTMSDIRNVGNKFSAKMVCTGKEKMEGTIESTNEGNRTYGRMTVKSSEGNMVMSFDTTKLGTACEAEDWTGYVPPRFEAPPAVDMCQTQGENLAKSELTSFVDLYTGKGECSKHATKKKFCDAVKSPAGYHRLNAQEKLFASIPVDKGDDPNSTVRKPLLRSMESCDLGSGPAAAAKLQASLIPVAEASNSWWFLLEYGDDAMFAKLVQTAKAECSGSAYTTPSNRRFARLCDPYGPALVRNDRAAVREIMGNGSDPGPTGGVSADAGSSASGTGPGATDSARRGGPQQPAGTAQPDSTKEKAKEALDAGKKVLRGIFGR